MRRAAPTTLLGAVLALATAAPALAQGTTPAPAPTSPPPSPAAGSLKLSTDGGLVASGRKYYLSGGNVTVRGLVKPFVAGQTVRVTISSAKRRPTVVRAKVVKAKGGGAFKLRFKLRRAVGYSVYARHDATPQQALFQAKTAVHAVNSSAGEGSRGMGVVLLKQGLRQLGYQAGNGPSWTGKLARSVLAFRKTNSMARTFSASRTVFQMVFAGRGAYKLRYPKAGKHVEADLSRQVLVLADRGKPVATYPTSSGAPATPTILGRYRFYLKTPGTNAKGMYMSNFFIRGYAIHGYPSVPTYPASHGCLRIPNADAVTIYNWVKLGDPIWVYR